MKKRFGLGICVLVLSLLLPAFANAAYEDMTWSTLNAGSTFDEPYTDYTSVFDKTKELYLFDEFEADLQALCNQFPDLVRLEVAGYSELGRPLYVMVIGSDYAPNRMFVLGTAHAREYAGTQLSVLQIEFYLHNYYNTINGERVCDLLDRCQYYFLPLFNPDGAMLSMQGLDSLDDERLTITASEKAEIEQFLLSQVDAMNTYCENNINYHDTDASFYSDNPDPERDDAFQYWKTNINGVDLHYNMYTPWMMEVWKEGTSYYNSQESFFTAPSWQNFAGVEETDGIELAAENRALRAYINQIQPNFFVSYHTASNVVQWNYGYGRMENGDALRDTAYDIAKKAGELLNFSVSETTNPHIGHPGWFMKNSETYMDACGYGITIELASRQYLRDVGEYSASYVDAPPTKVIQVTDDVTTTSGVQRQSLWTTGKFFPLALSQYIMDNRLIEEVDPAVVDPQPTTDVQSIFGQTPAIPGEIRLTVGGAPETKVSSFGVFQPQEAGKAAVVPSDILTDGSLVKLYNHSYLAEKPSSYIGENSLIRFSYVNADGSTVYATFTANRFVPLTAFAGTGLKVAALPLADHCTAAAPTLLTSVTEKGSVTLAENHAAATSADFSVSGGYTVTLYSDAAFTAPAQSIPLVTGENKLYVKAQSGSDAAYYVLKVINPPTNTDATIRENTGGSRHRSWTLTERAGTKASPDILQVRINGTYFGSSTVWNAATLLKTTHPAAVARLYSDAACTTQISSFTLGGAYVDGHKKDVWLAVTSADGTVTRYTRVEIRSWQEILAINGTPVTYLGHSNPSTANSSSNPMQIEVVLSEETATTNLIPMPRGDGTFLGEYPNVTYTTYDDGNGEAPLVIQHKSISDDANLPEGYDRYYRVSVWHEDTTKVYYQIQVKYADASIGEVDSGAMYRTWRLTENDGTVADPDVLELRVNAAYFGTSTVRTLAAMARPRDPAAQAQLYADAAFTSPIDTFTMQGGYVGGQVKDLWLRVISADGTMTRYTRIEIRPRQELLTINGLPVTYLGHVNDAAAMSSSNPMRVEVILTERQATTNLIGMPREDGTLTAAAYPNVTYTVYDEGDSDVPVILQHKDLTTDATVPAGYDSYYQIAVKHNNSKAYYQVQIRYSETEIEEVASGGIYRNWALTRNAGTTDNPDVLEVRVNAAYFGTSTVRTLAAIAQAETAGAQTQLYADAAFTTPVDSFTMQGGYADGFVKNLWLKVTSADNTMVRHTRIEIRSWQEILEINGTPVIFLGLADPSAAHTSTNPMCVEIALTQAQTTENLVSLPRGDGTYLGSYPNVTYTAYDDGSGESPMIIQFKSVSSDAGLPGGYDAYYKVSVWHEDSAKGYYQVQIKYIS